MAAPDLSVFSRQKSVDDYMRLEEEFQFQRQRALQAATGQDPAALKLANEYEAAINSGNIDRANRLAAFAKIYDKNVMQTPEGQFVPLPGLPSALGQLKYGEQQGAEIAKTQYEPGRAGMVEGAKLQQQLNYGPDIASAEKESVLRTEKEFEAPKAEARTRAILSKSQNLTNTIDKAKEKVGAWTAGAGSVLSGVPMTPAKDLSADLKTIKANIGFDELQEMRMNSPTGGALGQVAVQEIEFLQSVIANLDQSQSPKQLLENLEIVKKAKQESDKRILQAYQKDYNRFGNIELGKDPMQASRDAVLKRNAEGIKNPYGTVPPSPQNDVQSLIDRYAQ